MPIPLTFLPRDEAETQIHKARTSFAPTTFWVFTDGSVSHTSNGAAAVLFCSPSDLGTSFHITLGSFQSGTDVEIAGSTLALIKLSTLVSWSKAILVSDSQAAIQALSCLNWKSSRTSVFRFYSLWTDLQDQGKQIKTLVISWTSGGFGKMRWQTMKLA